MWRLLLAVYSNAGRRRVFRLQPRRFQQKSEMNRITGISSIDAPVEVDYQ
ncbi:MAG: hypothetical protein JO099_01265 [Acidobacteriia bacterium]|nr:hypothetical protein [Terriglobia bacterium]